MKKSKKILLICGIVLVVLVIIGMTGYIVYDSYQDKLEQEKQELIVNTEEKYNTLLSQTQLLIFNEEEQKKINVDLESIKKAIEEENVTEETKNVIENINSQIEETKNNNITLLNGSENYRLH